MSQYGGESEFQRALRSSRGAGTGGGGTAVGPPPPSDFRRALQKSRTPPPAERISEHHSLPDELTPDARPGTHPFRAALEATVNAVTGRQGGEYPTIDPYRGSMFRPRTLAPFAPPPSDPYAEADRQYAATGQTLDNPPPSFSAGAPLPQTPAQQAMARAQAAQMAADGGVNQAIAGEVPAPFRPVIAGGFAMGQGLAGAGREWMGLLGIEDQIPEQGAPTLAGPVGAMNQGWATPATAAAEMGGGMLGTLPGPYALASMIVLKAPTNAAMRSAFIRNELMGVAARFGPRVAAAAEKEVHGIMMGGGFGVADPVLRGETPTPEGIATGMALGGMFEAPRAIKALRGPGAPPRPAPRPQVPSKAEVRRGQREAAVAPEPTIEGIDREVAPEVERFRRERFAAEVGAKSPGEWRAEGYRRGKAGEALEDLPPGAAESAAFQQGYARGVDAYHGNDVGPDGPPRGGRIPDATQEPGYAAPSARMLAERAGSVSGVGPRGMGQEPPTAREPFWAKDLDDAQLKTVARAVRARDRGRSRDEIIRDIRASRTATPKSIREAADAVREATARTPADEVPAPPGGEGIGIPEEVPGGEGGVQAGQEPKVKATAPPDTFRPEEFTAEEWDRLESGRQQAQTAAAGQPPRLTPAMPDEAPKAEVPPPAPLAARTLREHAQSLEDRAAGLEKRSSTRFDTAPGAYVTGGSGRRRSGLQKKTDAAIEGSLNDLREAKALRERAATLRRRADNLDPVKVAEQDAAKQKRQDAIEAANRKESEERRAAPIVNRDGPGVVRMSREEWAKTPKDYKGVDVRDGERVRTVLKNSALSPVFITDAPETAPKQTRPAGPAADFAQHGPGHARFAENLERMTKDGTFSEAHRDVLLEAFRDTDDAMLGSIKAESAAIKGGRAEATQPAVLRIQVRRGLAALAGDEKATASDRAYAQSADVTPSVAFLHGYAHIAHDHVLTDAQRATVREVYDSRPVFRWKQWFSEGLSGDEKKGYEYFAKSPEEFLSQSFAEYVLTKRVSDSRLKALLDTLVEAVRKAVGRVMKRGHLDDLAPLYDIMLKGRQPEALERTAQGRTITERAAQRPQAGTEFPARGALKRQPATGKAAGVRLADGRTLPSRYEIVEADDLIPTHDPRRGYQPNPLGDANERAYEDPTEGDASRKTVRAIAEQTDPSLLLTNTPTPTDGPPITTEGYRVVGGNARSMGLQLMYHAGGDKAAAYKAALKASAHGFGIDPARVDGFHQPVLVRVLEGEPGKRGELSRALNASLTTEKTADTDAVSRGRMLDESAMDVIGEAMGDASLSDALSNKTTSDTILGALRESGAFSEADLQKYREADGRLNQAGKDAVERTLLGAAVQDVRALAETTPSVRNTLIRALPSITTLRRLGPKIGVDHQARLTNALDAIAELREAAGHEGGPRTIEELANQVSLVPQPWRGDPRAQWLARSLVLETQTKVAAKLRSVAAEARDQASGQEGFGGMPDSEGVFDKEFAPKKGTRDGNYLFAPDTGKPYVAPEQTGLFGVEPTRGKPPVPGERPQDRAGEPKLPMLPDPKVWRAGDEFKLGQTRYRVVLVEPARDPAHGKILSVEELTKSGKPTTKRGSDRALTITERDLREQGANPPDRAGTASPKLAADDPQREGETEEEFRLRKKWRAAEENTGHLFTRGPQSDDLDPLGFYHKSGRVIEDKVQGPVTADQLDATLRNAGITEDELRWTGLADLIEKSRASGKKLTPADLETALDEGRVEMREVVKAGEGPQSRAVGDATATFDRAGQEARRILEQHERESGAHAFDVGQTYHQFESVARFGPRDMNDAMDQFVGPYRTTYGSASADKLLGNERLRALLGEMRTAAEVVQRAHQMGGYGRPQYEQFTLPGGDNYREVLLTVPGEPRPKNENFATWAERNAPELNHEQVSVHFRQREQSELYRRWQAETGPDRSHAWDMARFRGGHFDEPNIVAHMRIKDRTTPDGKRVLFLEEVQSDWHQKGRDEGYQNRANLDALAKNVQAAGERSAKLMDRLIDLRDRGVMDRAPYPEHGGKMFVGDFYKREHWHDQKLYEEHARLSKEKDALDAEFSQGNAKYERMMRHGVPEGPLSKTWHEMAFRRAVRMAAEGGYDSVAWTTGKQQIERYEGLAQRVRSIGWEPDTRYGSGLKRVNISVGSTMHTIGVDKDGTIKSASMDVGDWNGKPLSDVLGVEAARKVLGEDKGEMAGGDIRIGGEGMREFYDRIMKRYADKFGKRFGARSGTTKVSVFEPGPVLKKPVPDDAVHSLPITDAMRESVMNEGTSLFTRSGPSPLRLAADRSLEALKDVAENVTRTTLAPLKAAARFGSRMDTRVRGVAEHLRARMKAVEKAIDANTTAAAAAEARGEKQLADRLRRKARQGKHGLETSERMAGRIDELADRLGAGTVEEPGYARRAEMHYEADAEKVRDILRPLTAEQRREVGRLASDRLEPGKASPEAVAANKALRKVFDKGKAGMEAAGRAGLKRKMMDGEFVELAGKGYWMPQVLNAEGRKMMRELSAEGWMSPKLEAIAEQMYETGKYDSPAEARKELFAYLQSTTRGLNQYFEQTRVPLPEWMVETDVGRVWEATLRKNARTVAAGEVFGGFDDANQLRDIEGLRLDLREAAPDHQREVGIILRHLDTELGLPSGALPKESAIVSGLTRINSARLLSGVFTALRNLGQPLINAADYGITPTLRGYFLDVPPFFRDITRRGREAKATARRAGALFTDTAMMDLVRPSGGRTWLDVVADAATVGQRMSEESNQVRTFAIARRAAESDLERLRALEKPDAGIGGAVRRISAVLHDPSASMVLGRGAEGASAIVRRRLARLGLDDDMLADKLASGARLTPEELDLAGWKMVHDTQFPMTAASKPGYFHGSPWWRLAMQYKTFGFRQAGLMYERVVKEAAMGNPAPLIRFGIMALVFNEALAVLKDYVLGTENSISSLRNRDDKDRARAISTRALKHLASGGIFGFLADTEFGVASWIGGPTAGMAAHTAQAALEVARRPTWDQASLAAKKFARQELPGPRAWIDAGKAAAGTARESRTIRKWRERGYGWREGRTNPDTGDSLAAGVERRIFGPESFRGGPSTLAYEFAARAIDAGDEAAASSYLEGILRGVDVAERKRTMEAVLASMRVRSPLGKVAMKDRARFLLGFPVKDRAEGSSLDAAWRLKYRRALSRAASAAWGSGEHVPAK